MVSVRRDKESDMPDVLVRGISDAALQHYATRAEQTNTSRNEALLAAIEEPVRPARQGRITQEDWARFREICVDLDNEEIMAQAWR